MKYRYALLLALLCSARLHAESAELAASVPSPPTLPYKVLARYPHAANSFTQGLEINGDALYESSGLYGQSFISRQNLPSTDAPRVAGARQTLPSRYFGEGLTVWQQRIYVLTWREQQGFIFDQQSLQKVGEFHIDGEGWGLAHNTQQLIISNGSATLQFLNPQTWHIEKTLTVTLAGVPLEQLNELEWIAASATGPARLLANIWQTDTIVAIDPTDGRVTARLDLSQLYPRGQRDRHADVLNGIAFDGRDNTLLITGKFWPYLYRLQLLQPLP